MAKVSYKEYRGKGRILFQGKFLTGSSNDNITLGAAYLGLFAGFIVYSFTLCPYLMSKNFPMLAYFPYLVYGIGIMYKIKTTITDPGIIPRGNLESAEQAAENGVVLQINDEDDCGDEQLLDISKSDGSGSSSNTAVERILEENKPEKKLDISIYKHRHCRTCKIMRPPKASHCGDCDNCVKEFDHHCYFVGNCIGRRNHKYFFLFLFCIFVCCFYTTIVSALGLYSVLSNNPEIFTHLGNQLSYWVPAGIFLLLGTCCCNSRICRDTKYVILGLGFFIALLGVIMATRGLDLRWYENPATFLGFIIAVTPFTIWIFFAFWSNVFRISRGLTHKQEIVIDREVPDHCTRMKVYNVTFAEKIRNIKEFLLRKNIESQFDGIY